MREVPFDDVALGEEVRKIFLHSVRDTNYFRCIILLWDIVCSGYPCNGSSGKSLFAISSMLPSHCCRRVPSVRWGQGVIRKRLTHTR